MVICWTQFRLLLTQQNDPNQPNNIDQMSVFQNRFQQNSPYNQPSPDIIALFDRLQTLPNSQSQYVRYYRINSLLYTLLKLKETVAGMAVTKSISLFPAYSQALQYLQELDGGEIKESILANICSFIDQLKIESKKLKQRSLSQAHKLETKCQFSREDLCQLANLVLSKLMEKVKNSLKIGSNKRRIYSLIQFKWNMEFVKLFILQLGQNHQNLLSLENQIDQLYSNLSNQKYFQYKSYTKRHSDTLQYEKMSLEELLKCIDNKTIARLLSKEFEILNDKLNSKDQDCKNFQTILDDFQQIIKNQITLLSKQQAQKQILLESLLRSENELRVLNQKSQFFQQQLSKLDNQINILKESNLATQQSYYINPKWQKQQLQQKFYVELIQLESDLLLQKDQVKDLVNIILQEIKLSHQHFYDLKASKFLICRFDREVAKLLKAAPAFEKINLEEHLILRQVGMESESSPEMQKSTISTFSEVDTQTRSRTLTLRQLVLFQSQEFRQE